jgi:hypothetical protein
MQSYATMIYTSYYWGKQRGRSLYISLYPPKDCVWQKLPLFAPTRELLNFWKNSPKDKDSQDEYIRRFSKQMLDKDIYIEVWLDRMKRSGEDVTLNCYEKPSNFCHRHIVGNIIKQKRACLWGGEVEQDSSISTEVSLAENKTPNQLSLWDIAFLTEEC